MALPFIAFPAWASASEQVGGKMAVVAIAEPEALLRDTLAVLLRAAGEDVAGCVGAADGLAPLLEQRAVDVAIVGVASASDPAAQHALELLQDRHPELHLVLLAGPGTLEDLRALFAAGAEAILDRNSADWPEVLSAVRGVVRGETWVSASAAAPRQPIPAPPQRRARSELDRLSERELDVLAALARGCDNLKIGALLGIKERTVKTHVSAIYRKLQVENRLELALIARRHGLHLRGLPGSPPEPRPPDRSPTR